MKKRILYLVSFACLLLFLLPSAFGVFNVGSLGGVTLALLGFLYGRCDKVVDAKVASLWKKTGGKIVLTALLLLALCMVGLLGRIVLSARQTNEGGRTVVVLGCQVRGTQPSLMLSCRLEAARDYLLAHEEAVAVLSGGQGADEDISEAECMYRYLTACGIEPARLYKEDASSSTRENLQFSKSIIEHEGLDANIVIVTNGFHEYRAGRIADSLGLSHTAYAGKTPFYLAAPYYLRECFGVLYEWMDRLL